MSKKRKRVRPEAVRPPQKPPPKPMLLTLCSPCAQQFYDSPEHRIRRADYEEIIWDTCDYCAVRRGYTFIITERKG